MAQDKNTHQVASFPSDQTYITEYFEAQNFQFRNNIFTYDVIRTGKRKKNGHNLGDLDQKVIYQSSRNLNSVDKARYVRDTLPLEPYLKCKDYPIICQLLGVPQPKWLQILQNYNADCALLQQEFHKVEVANQIREERWLAEQKKFHLKKTTYREKSNLWPVLLLAPFTFGLSFCFLTTKAKAQQNVKRNQTNQEWNAHFLQEQRQKFEMKPDRQLNQARIRWGQESEVFAKKYRNFTYHRLFLADCNLIFYDATILTQDKKNKALVDSLWKQSGIYIIWNVTKQNKYYVGQTNDLYRRLVNEHFSLKSNLSGENNRGFLNDMLNHCTFYFSFIPCANLQTTKDEIERELISRLKAVEFGYNKSGGNS